MGLGFDETYRLILTLNCDQLGDSFVTAFSDFDGPLRYPLVIHPSLDTAMDSIQRSLKILMATTYHQEIIAASLIQILDAFRSVNNSLFLNPVDVEGKALAMRW